MTRSPDELRRIDAKVAEAMGLCPHLYEYYEPEKTYCETCKMQLTGFYDDDHRCIRCRVCGKEVRGLRYRVNGQPDCLHYTTSWSAAGQVVDRIDEQGKFYVELYNDASGYSLDLTPIRLEDEADFVWGDRAPSGPEAICLGFLQAMGVEVGE